MRLLKFLPLIKFGNSYLIDSPQPANLNYLWNFGSLLAISLIMQIVTGVTLAMHYNPSINEAFNSVEHIMRDVNNGWLIRYLHSNTASAFFFLVYLHIGRGMYYGSYQTPRILVWVIGTIIFIVMIVTAFLGYVLPFGQMSLWGATVITNLMSAIPWIGQDIVEFIWGGFSVNNATLNRFFSLHFLLPFVLAALAAIHLIVLHETAGSNNPIGISGNYDRLPFSPYYIFKDLITIFLFFFILSIFVFFMPNVLGDSDNYVMANPMQTPPAIVPEWYLLPFYAILRSIPNKLLGVIAMLSAILALLVLPFGDISKTRGMQFKPLIKTIYLYFISNFIILGVLGAKHVEAPYIEIGQISTILYFTFFAFIFPTSTFIENTFSKVGFLKSSLAFITSVISSNNVLGYRNYSTLTNHKFSIADNIYLKFNFILIKFSPQIIIMFIYAIYILSFNLLSIYLFLEISMPNPEIYENFIIYLYNDFSFEQGLHILNMDPGSTGDNSQGGNPTPGPSGGGDGGPNPGGGNNPGGLSAVPVSMEAENDNDNDNDNYWNVPESPSAYDGTDIEELRYKAKQYEDKVDALSSKRDKLLESDQIARRCENNVRISDEENRTLQTVLSKINDNQNNSVSGNLVIEVVSTALKMLDAETKQEEYLNKATELEKIQEIEQQRGITLSQEQRNTIRDQVKDEALANHRANVRAFARALAEEGNDNTNTIGLLNTLHSALNPVDPSEVSDEDNNNNNSNNN